MRAGELRHVISIQEPTETADGAGGVTTTWSTKYSRVRAAIWPLRGDERVEAMKLEHELTHRVRIRYQSGITAKMRIYWADRSRYLRITDIFSPDERNISLEIMATEEVA